MQKEVERYQAYRKDPLLWVRDIFGIQPQRIKDHYINLLKECRETGNYDPIMIDMFEPFVKYKMLSWQQTEILLAIARAMNGEDKRKIAIRSGHGIGKSSVISIFQLRFLFCFKYSVIGCTAPGKVQMEDVLRKELALWIGRLPIAVQKWYNRSKDYIRVGQAEKDQKARYSRAKTSTKENSEALAGLHSEYLAIVADEASGVDEQIFITAMSARTNKNTLFIMISNPTRLEGYFYKAFTANRKGFQTLNFNSEQSPLVDEIFIDEIIQEYGEDSDVYRVRVQGEFPRAELVDNKGYIPLFNPGDIAFVPQGTADEADFNTLGIDPSGNGKDFSSFVARNSFIAKRGKGGYIDAVFFTEELREQVFRYREAMLEYTKNRKINSDFIFVGLSNKNYGNPLKPKYVNLIYSKYSEKLIEDGKIERKLKTHMGRHSFATNCVFSGVSQQATTKLMRHRDPKTTLRYYHLDNSRLRGEFDKIK